MPSGRLSGANAAAAEGPGISQLEEVAPLPALSAPVEPLVNSEPPTGVTEPLIQTSSHSSSPLLKTLPLPQRKMSSTLKQMSFYQGSPLFDDLLSPAEEKLPHIDDYWSDNEHIFLDANTGGLAIAPAQGLVLIVRAWGELHSATATEHLNHSNPTCLSLHENLSKSQYCLELNKIKVEAKEAKNKKMKASEQKYQAANEGPELPSEVNELDQISPHKALTLTHDNVVTVSP
ncbi:Methylcytosine dioxygenase TET1 [Plecturocebus cupreus]